MCVCVCVDLLTGGRCLYHDGVSTHMPELSPHLAAAFTKIKVLPQQNIRRVPFPMYTLTPLCHQIRQMAPQCVPPVPSPNPSIAPTRTGKRWIHISSLHPHSSGRLAYQQCNWLYAAFARQYSGKQFLAQPCQEHPLSLGTSTYRLEASLASCLTYTRQPLYETLSNSSNSLVTNSMSCCQTAVSFALLLCRTRCMHGGMHFLT